jgi:hypothetical protein
MPEGTVRYLVLGLLGSVIASASAQRPFGPIRFVDATAASGISFHHHSGAFGKKYLPETMGSGVCVLDYDNDGFQDILFVNSMDWPGHASTKNYPALYHNNGDGTFTDRTRQAGLAVESYGMGCAVGDYDNDGKDDIYITAVGNNHLFHNLGNGRFADVTAHAKLAGGGFSSGAVWFDTTTTASLISLSPTMWSGRSPRINSAPSTRKTNPTVLPRFTKARARGFTTIEETEPLRM